MAPIASITEPAFLRLLDDLGGIDILYTDLISAEAIVRRNEKTLDRLVWKGFKTPLFVQLFGHNPESLVRAARYIEEETGFAGIDINMGCPVPKVVKKGAGAALLKDHGKIREIVSRCKARLSLPVTAKIRLGFNQVNVLETARILEEEGIDGITVHFRLRTDSYSIPARWEYAPSLKKEIRCPLIGNGDIQSRRDIEKRLPTVDAVMIGRAAVRDPRIFSRYAAGGDGDQRANSPVITQFLERLEELYDAPMRVVKFKPFIRYFFSRQPNAKTIRSRLYDIQNYRELKQYLQALPAGSGDFDRHG